MRQIETEAAPSYLRYSGWTGSKELIVRLIPPRSSVLDIGCSSGVLGKRLRDRGCSVSGVEVDQQAAVVAEQSYEKVFVGDIQTLIELPSSLIGAFDVLVFADVLEHLQNPDDVLMHFLRYLKPEGKTLISVPNVANWLNRLQLLIGLWQYKDRGILDRTHLRFYTYKGAKQLIGQSGLRINRVVCTSGLHGLDLRFGLQNPANIWKGLLAFQFIFDCGIDSV